MTLFSVASTLRYCLYGYLLERPWDGYFWNYTIWGSINCNIWTQSGIIIVEKVTKKQSWHSLQDQGNAAISLAKPLHWRRVGCNIERISCIRYYLMFIFIYLYIYNISLIITGVQASGVIIDCLLRQCCFVWSEIVGPHSSGNFNDWPLKLKAGSKI